MLALLVAACSFAVPATAAPPACATEGAFRTGADGWTRIAGPEFSAGGPAMTSYAVDERRPERLFATNGVAIASSRDGGCTWTQAALPAEQLETLPPPLNSESGRIAQRRLLDVRLPFVSATTVWALGLNDISVGSGTPLVQPRVLLSMDGGKTFAAPQNTNLPAVARPRLLRTSTLPLEAYLLLDRTLPSEARELWWTLNGGATWEQRATNLPEFTDLVVDPYGKRLWAWDATSLYLSDDGGTSFGRVGGIPAAVLGIDVTPTFTTIVFANATRLDVPLLGRPYLSSANELVTSVAAGPLDGLVAMSSTVDGVAVHPPGAEHYDVTPDDVNLSQLAMAQVMVEDTYMLYGFHPQALYRRPVTLTPPVRPVIKVQKRVPPPPMKATLRPAGSVVTLKPEEKRRVPFDLVLPPAPTPLDVYFMTDSTGSMQDAIGAVQESVQEIVDALTAARIDLHFGVADFRDWPQGPDGETYPYRRHRAVGPVNDDLGDALAGITTGGGTGDDSALEAVYQAVTGAGRDGIFTDIAPDQGAQFRPEALKVVLLASDEEMRDPSPSEPWNQGPTKAEVVDALNDAGVEIVGIKVDSGPNDGNPRPEMEELARAAGSVAPEGGVDCDDDDEVDLHEGDPLVCDFSSGGGSIAAAFVNMLRGIEDRADVHVGVTGPRDVVRHLGETTFAAVNVKKPNTFPVPVEFACTKARYGTDTPVTIAGELRGTTVVSGTATVRCLAPPKKNLPPLPPPPPQVFKQPPPRPLRAAAIPPPPPPQPNTNMNPNPNPNPQGQGQAGMASQEDQQHQLALAENDMAEDDELAFSGIDSSKDVAPAATLIAGVLVACAAAGTQLHLARRTRVATNPSRTTF